MVAGGERGRKGREGGRRSSLCECRSPQLCIPAELSGTHQSQRSPGPRAFLWAQSEDLKGKVAPRLVPVVFSPYFDVFDFFGAGVEWFTFRHIAVWTVREEALCLFKGTTLSLFYCLICGSYLIVATKQTKKKNKKKSKYVSWLNKWSN